MTDTWQDQAQCGNTSPDDFFFDGRFHEGSPNYVKHVAMLRAICHTCPVRRQCDAFAEEMNITDGFWAGLTAQQRMQRRRRKSPAAIQESFA